MHSARIHLNPWMHRSYVSHEQVPDADIPRAFYFYGGGEVTWCSFLALSAA
jgi:hypothetical protein